MLAPSNSATVAISGSVGFGGQNREADVKIVQVLLNAKLPIPLQRLEENGICDGQTIFAIRTYQTRNLGSHAPDGRVDVGGATFRSLAGKKAATPPAAAGDGKKYTDNPNERVTTRTTPAYADVVAMLLVAWPDLNQNGARTLTAQFVAETGGGKYCFNWNLGNEKAGANIPHMYLRNVWECASLAGSVTMVERSLSSTTSACPNTCTRSTRKSRSHPLECWW